MIFCVMLWNLLSVSDMLYYQQNRYQKDRYKMSIGADVLKMMMMVSGGCLVFILDLYNQLIFFYLFALLIFPACLKNKKESIQSLVFTQRMMRLIGYQAVADILFLLIIWLLPWVFFDLLILFAILFHHSVFYLFVLVSDPLEIKIKKSYVLRAKKKLGRYTGLKIGITGSYGKTSIKNLLYDVLSMQYACLKTPASYNNEMGICRTVLERMNHQEIFICEMGADHVHEIEDLCTFVKPTLGILCAVGPQHLSTFKTMENILNEKMKLLESLPEEGIGFFNFDNFYLHGLEMDVQCEVVRVGIQSEASLKALHIQSDHLGSQFDVMLGDELVHFTTSLLGEHNILNCLFAIGVAAHLKVKIPLIQIAIMNAKPTEHRLELKPFYKGMCIDNAYNSNPDSAKMALKVLKGMPGHHYLITPGFIDLGEHHSYYSREFGRNMGFCDFILLIGECSDILEGLQEISYDMKKIIQTDTMKNALLIMSTVIEEGDTLLIENDIPEVLMNEKQVHA